MITPQEWAWFLMGVSHVLVLVALNERYRWL